MFRFIKDLYNQIKIRRLGSKVQKSISKIVQPVKVTRIVEFPDIEPKHTDKEIDNATTIIKVNKP